MISYSEETVFARNEICALNAVSKLVGRLHNDVLHGDRVRCHELARAVARYVNERPRAVGAVENGIDLTVADGVCGGVQHSWLWTREPSAAELKWWRTRSSGWFHATRPRILDVYAVGKLPQVQLVDTFGLLHVDREFRLADNPELSIHDEHVDAIVKYWHDTRYDQHL